MDIWHGQQVEICPVSELTEYSRNSRTHTPAQIKQIEASIREFGFTSPILIDGSGEIIAGHGRIAAARNMGVDAVPCLRFAHMTDAQRRAYVIADNKLAENAGWDKEMLGIELGELASFGFDLGLLGFSVDELDEIVGHGEQGGLTEENDAPLLPEEPITVPGNIWELGGHRIICGSSTDGEVVSALLNGAKPHIMVTDPPYGVEYNAGWRDKLHGNRAGGGVAKGAVLNDHNADWSAAWALFPGDVAYVWHASTFADVVSASLLNCGLEIRSQIIWAKSQLVISRGNYHPQHEPCWYAVRKGKTAHWQGSRRRSTVWRDIDDVVRENEGVFVRREDAETLFAISGDESTIWDIPKPLKSETGHSTQKPVECMRRPILNNSKAGDLVYEPFSGSGTTIIAAEQTGRICYAVELSPAYVDVAVKRWENFTGRKATRT